jgi:SET domain-containing protein
LFADAPKEPDNAVIFEKGEKIIGYYGEQINLAELNHRYDQYTGPYAFGLTQQLFEDGALRRGVGSLANTKKRRKDNNATLIVDQRRKLVSLRATKDIFNGEEIFCYYGDDYEMDDGSSYTTTRK